MADSKACGIDPGAPVETIETQVCITGGGPAGMVLAYLLARAGIEVTVLEKHADFLRDFRGDTIHPSTLDVMHELGLLEDLLKQPHEKVDELRGTAGDYEVTIADFSHLPTHCRYIALMPQWDFLNFLVAKAKQFPTFHIRMEANMQELIVDHASDSKTAGTKSTGQGSVVGVRAKTPIGTLEVRAGLTVGADGRHSTVRAQADLKVINVGAPMDVLWMRVPRLESDPYAALGRFNKGRILVLIYRGSYWQCGFVIPKGGIDALKQRGLPEFQREVRELAPFLGDRVQTLDSWDKVSLLTVAVDHLETWHRPGMLCIGDAAHAMSPVGGVGINIAIQDAVATANLLWEPLANHSLTEADLKRVQHRREWAVRMTQRAQVFIQDRVISRTLESQDQIQPPLVLKMLKRFAALRRIPARMVGMGVRPEHVHSPNAFEHATV
jgi:2-polyprenyl-6-methoxyphenol hydroxylase-like FAD-dependent oxidoreductase